jgi:shikimate kinase
MSPVVVLVGVPGAGKTTVGLAIAEELGVAFCDTDQVIEKRQAKTVADIFIEDGEVAFRELERAAVAEALARHTGVLALGGGAILNSTTRELLRGEPVAWLQVAADAASRRVGMNAARPMLMGNVRGRMIELSRERTPLYEEVASLGVDTNQRTPEEIAAGIIVDLALSKAT